MARLNLEDKLFNDSRFRALMRRLGEKMAIGEWVLVARAAQEYWIKDRGLIPLNIWDLNEFSDELLRCELVEKRDDGYYLKGSENYFSWYEDKCKLAKKGRDAIAAKKQEKSNIRSNPSLMLDLSQQPIRSNTSLMLDLVEQPIRSPLTLTPTLTPIIKKESVSHENIRTAWNEIAGPNGLPSCRAINDNRIKAISKAEAQNPDLDWPSFFATLPRSRFLMGENDRNWKVDFDFAINSNNINKILEGKYENTLSKKIEEEQKKNDEWFFNAGQISEETPAVDFSEPLKFVGELWTND